jgi:hypothetical protein
MTETYHRKDKDMYPRKQGLDSLVAYCHRDIREGWGEVDHHGWFIKTHKNGQKAITFEFRTQACPVNVRVRYWMMDPEGK